MSTTLIVWANNASSLLASGITGASTTCTVTAGEGALFPVISAGQYAVGTLEDTGGNIEVVYITGRTTDTMTITRAQESTSARSFASGSRFELRVTAGVLATLLQKTGADTLSGTTTLSGVLALGSGGSIRSGGSGGEIAGLPLRGAPALTSNQILIPSDGSAPTLGASPILTTNNLVSELPAGVGAVLTGMVLFWSGASNAIPSGYVLCDGTNFTPDLRDKFIVGGGGSLPSTGGSVSTTTGATDVGTITIAPHVLTVAELPHHHHTFFNNTPGRFLGNATSGYAPDWGANGAAGDTIGGGPYNGTQIIGDTGGDTGHTHDSAPIGSHSHTYAQMPPYRAVFAIMKT